MVMIFLSPLVNRGKAPAGTSRWTDEQRTENDECDVRQKPANELHELTIGRARAREGVRSGR
jgi:hypothetical protein